MVGGVPHGDHVHGGGCVPRGDHVPCGDRVLCGDYVPRGCVCALWGRVPCVPCGDCMQWCAWRGVCIVATPTRAQPLWDGARTPGL